MEGDHPCIMAAPRYKLYAVEHMGDPIWLNRPVKDPIGFNPGATYTYINHFSLRTLTYVLTPVGRWWTPNYSPGNCKMPDLYSCGWDCVAEGSGIDLHIPKGPCPYCGIGNGSIGIIHPDGYLWYHGYIQHGWLEGD